MNALEERLREMASDWHKRADREQRFGDKKLGDHYRGAAADIEDALRIHGEKATAPNFQRASCSGITATWCPVHGDCRCPIGENGERSLDDAGCPLHSNDSQHGES